MLVDRKSNVNYVPAAHAGYLVRVKTTNKKELAPSKMQANKNLLHFSFAEGIALQVKVAEKATHLRFELIKTKQAKKIDAVLWGPFNTTINETIGEVVGVVRNQNFAIGLQALNTKTVGGKLLSEAGATAGFAGITGSTATAEPFGSALQAFCINSAFNRTIEVLQVKNRAVPV